MIDLECSSFSHVCDRAKAFLFCDPPYRVASVRPDGFVMERKGSESLYVKVAGKTLVTEK